VLNACALPLTGLRCVHQILTDLAFLEVTPEGLVLRELAPGATVEEVQAKTEAPLKISTPPKTMRV